MDPNGDNVDKQKPSGIAHLHIAEVVLGRLLYLGRRHQLLDALEQVVTMVIKDTVPPPHPSCFKVASKRRQSDQKNLLKHSSL